MRFPMPLVLGRLVRRYKRFLADVTLETGELIVAHVPNTGSMMSTREAGSEVAVSRSDNPNRKLAYTLELVRAPGGAWVGVNTARTNALAEEAIEKGHIPALSGFERLRREVRFGERSRVDLLLEGTDWTCHVEVKNVTYRSGELALFPDAVTERGARHLTELMRVVENGSRAAMLFVVNRSDCQAMAPATDIDPVYSQRLVAASRAGVELYAYAAEVSPSGIQLQRCLEIRLPQ